MELFQEIMVKVLAKEEVTVIFPNLDMRVSELMEMECFDALQKIKTIIKNDSLNDFECVEEIVCVLEEFGSNGGNRHNWG